MRMALALALGGALGTLARYGLQGLVQAGASGFPSGTLTVNIVGSFALGFLMRLLVGSLLVTPEVRAAVTIGFCGAFTTMSTFAYETVMLFESGEAMRGTLYLVGSVGGSLLALAAGLGVASWIL